MESTTLDSVTAGSSWGDFFTGVGGLADKYLSYRLTKTTNTIAREGQPVYTVGGQAVPGWVLPAALLGGLALVVVLVARR